MESPPPATLKDALRPRLQGRVLDAPVELEARSTDFGGMARVLPALVVLPVCVEDVQSTLRFAAEHGLSVSIRGAGHSQSGQGLGAGLLLDMTALDRVVLLDTASGVMEIEAGITWRAVVDATTAVGFLPATLTYALDTTVAGTLSVGGVGSAAWNHGPQVDGVLYLDVVTASGELVRCSLDQERELFDAVRAGLGQCGVIVRAGIPVRPCGAGIRTRTFVYRDLGAFLSDARLLTHEPKPGRLLAVRVGRDPLRPASLMVVVFVGHDVATPDDRIPDLPPLHHDYEPPLQAAPTWTRDGAPGHPFFRVFGSPNQAGEEPRRRHPWVDFLYTRAQAPAALATLASFERVLKYGTAELILVRRGPHPAPLLVTPTDELLFGLGAYPAFGADEAELAVGMMREYLRAMTRCGGVRYLSGYFDPAEPTDWARHYGSAWSGFVGAKAKYDPARRFDSGLVRLPPA